LQNVIKMIKATNLFSSQKTHLFFIVVLCCSLTVTGQIDLVPKATEFAENEKFLAAGLESYRVGEEYEDIAKTTPFPEANYPKALTCFVRAAGYFDTASEKWGDGAIAEKNKSLQKANEILLICRTKKYKIPKGVIEEIERLSKDSNETVEDEKPKDDDPVVDDEDIADVGPERRVVFSTKDGVYSVRIPAPLELETIFGTKVKYFTSNQITMILNEKGRQGFSNSNFNKYDVRGYQISLGFEAMARTKLTELLNDSGPKFSKERNARTFDLGNEKYELGSLEARLTYDWEWEIDGPTQAKEDLMATINIKFKTKGYFNKFGVGVRNLDEIKIEKKVMEMVRSFRKEGDLKPEKECKKGDLKPLDSLAILVSWKIPHPTKRPFVIQNPVLERNKVPAAWVTVTNRIISFLKLGKGGIKNYRTFDEVISGSYQSAVLKRLGWTADYLFGIEFIPVNMDVDMESSKIGVLTNAVIFYLQALEASSKGISGLEKQITNMGIDVYWEVPYVEIKGVCIPQLKCKDGKWVPDYSGPVFKEVLRDGSKYFHAGNLKFLTKHSVEHELEEKFKKEISKLEETLKEFNSKDDKCKNCMNQFYDLVWPTDPDPCALLRSKLKNINEDIRLAVDEKKNRQLDLQEWLKLKPQELKELNAIINEFNAAIAENERKINDAEIQLSRQEALKLNYEKNNLTHTKMYRDVLAKIQELKTEIGLLRARETELKQLRAILQAERDRIMDGTIENEKSDLIKNLENLIIQLKKERNSIQSRLNNC